MTDPTPAKGIRGWLSNLDRYWFGHGSPVTMAVIRIFIGFLAFANLVMLSVDFDDWFTETGYVPQAVANRVVAPVGGVSTLFDYRFDLGLNVPRLNVLGGVTDTRFTIFVYVLTALAAVTTMLGLWTRVSTILLAVGTVSLQHRNGFITHGGDTVLRIMTLYLAISPCGVACSMDRIIGLWKGIASKIVPTVSLWPQRLIAYNVALVYFTTFWHKMNGDQWRDGTATWYPARLHEFERFPVPSFLNDPPMIYFTTYGTLAIELALGTLVFYRPLRRWVILGGLGLHAYIEYSMNIPLFSFFMCVGYFAFFEGEELSAWANRMGERLRRFKVQVLLPRGTSLKPGPANALEAMDTFNLVQYAAGSDSEWEGRNAKDESIPAVRASWTRTFASWPIGWIPGIWRKVLDRATGTADASPATSTESKKVKAVTR